jgi:uncharacterized pyridoxamine 5'-phosphate oxidase family protein
MEILPSGVINFFHSQNYLIVSTIGKDGSLHNSCKGLIDIDQNGKVYLLDVYRGKTYQNLQQNPNISITAVDEHKFKGYSLKGKAQIVSEDKLEPRIVKAWEDKITSRITQRVIKNITQSKGHPRHPEARLPKPKYMISVEVKEVIDLTPHHLR